MRISDRSSDVCSSDLDPARSGQLRWRVADFHRGFARPDAREPERGAAGRTAGDGRQFERQSVSQPVAVEQLRPCARILSGPRFDVLGSASCREKVCQYVKMLVVAVYLKKKKKT